jgi:hypothetical protein
MIFIVKRIYLLDNKIYKMESLICQGCKQMFDTELRVPVLLLTCFHSLCIQCYVTKSKENDKQPQEKIITCPEDGVSNI